MNSQSSVTVKVTPQLDADAIAEIKATLRGVALDAITDALYAVASGMTLSDDEEQLLDKFRRCPEQHRIAALRTLDRRLPVEEARAR